MTQQHDRSESTTDANHAHQHTPILSHCKYDLILENTCSTSAHTPRKLSAQLSWTRPTLTTASGESLWLKEALTMIVNARYTTYDSDKLTVQRIHHCIHCVIQFHSFKFHLVSLFQLPIRYRGWLETDSWLQKSLFLEDSNCSITDLCCYM